MREIIKGKMIQLGHGRWVRSDVIIAVEPISNSSVYHTTDYNGNLLRSRVLINHAEGEMMANRTAETILKSMTVRKSDGKLNEFGKAIENLQKEFSQGIVPEVDNEKELIINALIASPTVKWAIERLPFSKNKYYKLVQKHNIDVKAYLEASEVELMKDQQDDGLV